MNLRELNQIFSVRDLRNAVVGLIVIVGGIGLSGLTLYAHRSGNIRLAGISAAISLVFVVLILIFVVPPLARNAGREASQMNLPFEFTTGGAIILGLIAIVGFSAWNTGNNLLFIVLSFLIASTIVSFFAGSISLKKLDVKMRFPDTILAGELTPILVSLHNRKRLFPAFSIVAEVRGRDRDRSIAADEFDRILPAWIARRLGRAPLVRRTLNHFVFVKRHETVEAKTHHTFTRRGRLLIADFELSSKFPFGFFRHRRRLPARETELFVFPRSIPFELDDENMPLNAGQFTATKRGMGQDLLALRDYQPNDDLRHIDWKATARTRLLTVREFAADDDKLVTIFLDPYLPEVDGQRPSLREKIAAEQSGKDIVMSTRFETGVGICAHLLTQFASENAGFRLIIGSEIGELSEGKHHLYESLKRLAVTQPVFLPEAALSEHQSYRERILNELDDSHWIMVTAHRTAITPPDPVQTLKIIDF